MLMRHLVGPFYMTNRNGVFTLILLLYVAFFIQFFFLRSLNFVIRKTIQNLEDKNKRRSLTSATTQSKHFFFLIHLNTKIIFPRTKTHSLHAKRCSQIKRKY